MLQAFQVDLTEVMVWKSGPICGAVLLFESNETFELRKQERNFLQNIRRKIPSKVVFTVEDRDKGLREDPK